MCLAEKRGDMEREASMLAILEQCRQLLECRVAYFIPGCADPTLRHPLLDLIPENFWPVLLSGETAGVCTPLAGLRMEEPVRAVCDLAMQHGRIQRIKISPCLARRWRFQSIAAIPLERPAGTLGAFLLADECPRRFGAGEERLVYAYLSMQGAELERACWRLAREAVQASGKSRESASGTRESFNPSEFIAIVGHELRIPLSIIKGYAGLLQAYGGATGETPAPCPPEYQRHFLDVIVEQSDLLELHIDDLLDMARLQRGKLLLRPRIVDVGALCRRVIQLGQLRADQRERGKHQLECRLSAQLPPLLADAERLQQILMNVVENAIKYSPQGGHILLEAGWRAREERTARSWCEQRSQACVYIIVRDRGMGMPTQFTRRLFQPFERAGQTATARIPGLGLGLYITHQLVEAMGGTIDIQSCEGSGTNVTITLPAVSPRGAEISGASVRRQSLQIP